MKKRVLRFQEYIREQFEDPNNSGTSSNEPDTQTSAPETEEEAKSRIAKGLLKGLFGDFKGLDDGIDALIDQTDEVKQAKPYRGCGATEPYPLERKPMSVETAKILMEYLDSKGKGNYKRALKELEEDRSVILGVRNKIDVKKESANNDRFTDALYIFPQGSSKESEKIIAAEKEKIAQKEKEKKEKEAEKQKRLNQDDPLARVAKTRKGTETTEKEEEIDLGEKFTPYQITTSPSLAYYGEKPVNPKGTGIKLPGDTLYYLQDRDIGHGSYKMMVEGEPIEVGRYPIGVKKYDTYLPAEKFKENTGMQIHRSSTTGKGICVGPWSAGCQVFDDINEYNDFISKASQQTNNGGKFIYALIQLDDIPDDVMEKALKGERPNESIASSEQTPPQDDLASNDDKQNQPKKEVKRGVAK